MSTNNNYSSDTWKNFEIGNVIFNSGDYLLFVWENTTENSSDANDDYSPAISNIKIEY